MQCLWEALGKGAVLSPLTVVNPGCPSAADKCETAAGAYTCCNPDTESCKDITSGPNAGLEKCCGKSELSDRACLNSSNAQLAHDSRNPAEQ